jgi:hypothetical protein
MPKMKYNFFLSAIDKEVNQEKHNALLKRKKTFAQKDVYIISIKYNVR